MYVCVCPHWQSAAAQPHRLALKTETANRTISISLTEFSCAELRSFWPVHSATDRSFSVNSFCRDDERLKTSVQYGHLVWRHNCRLRYVTWRRRHLISPKGSRLQGWWSAETWTEWCRRAAIDCTTAASSEVTGSLIYCVNIIGQHFYTNTQTDRERERESNTWRQAHYAQVCSSLTVYIFRLSSSECPDVKNDGLTRSGTGCFIAVPLWQWWVSKGY